MKRHLMVCMYGLLCLSMIAVLVGCTPAPPPSAPVTPVQPTPTPLVTPSQAALEDLNLPAHGDTTLLTSVISPPDEGRDHIWPDHPVEYKTIPPTSGPHFPDPTAPGFYTTRPAFGYLVHSLEHGSVVIYYDPSQLTPEIERSLKAFIKANSDPEVGIVAIPDADFKYPFILTAWDKMLQLNKYDPQVVRAFLAEFLGRGPESPSR